MDDIMTCAEPRIKAFIAEEIEKSSLPEDEKQGLISYLKKLPLCCKGIPIQIQREQAKTRKKRAPSAYNLFIKQCFGLAEIKSLSGGAPAKMKACSRKWKETKK